MLQMLKQSETREKGFVLVTLIVGLIVSPERCEVRSEELSWKLFREFV